VKDLIALGGPCQFARRIAVTQVILNPRAARGKDLIALGGPCQFARRIAVTQVILNPRAARGKDPGA
jgi:hypothetical protein